MIRFPFFSERGEEMEKCIMEFRGCEPPPCDAVPFSTKKKVHLHRDNFESLS